MNLIFIDFEVFKEDWLMVGISPKERNETIIVNDPEQLKEYYNQHKDDIFVGFNIKGYDQYIFKGIMLGFNPKEINDFIILKSKPGWKFTSLFNKISMNIFDVKTSFHGLKTLEGFMGNNIKESSVNFLLNRKLTQSEIDETIKYCRHDVEQTIQVFLRRKEEFDAHINMLNTFNLPLKYVSKTKVQLSATILGAKQVIRNDEFDFTFVDVLKLGKYQHIMDWYKDQSNWDYSKSYNVEVAGVPHTFAYGGLHGARTNYISSGEFLNVDVASYYPSLMLNYNFGSRNCPSFNKYREIYETRLALKAAGKKKEQAPYKIVLNGTYGAMKDCYNPLYDPLQANNVCINGQLMLLDLIEKLEPYCELIQSNTDGILVKLRSNREQIISICKEWEDRTGMVLEFDDFVKVIQRDVNNYILIDKQGNYKSKGAYVKSLNDLDYNLAIVNEAMIDYFVKGIPVDVTIYNCNDLKKFQQIVKLGPNYTHALHGNTILREKTLRVFASSNMTDRGVSKVKNTGHIEKFSDTPFNCFIINDDINGMICPDNLNKEYYIDMANKRINGFRGTIY